MKKKLEAELISIAHRILKLKNKSELDQLYSETRALYEKLAVLRFAEEHFGDPKPSIGIADVESALENEITPEEPADAPQEFAEPEAVVDAVPAQELETEPIEESAGPAVTPTEPETEVEESSSETEEVVPVAEEAEPLEVEEETQEPNAESTETVEEETEETGESVTEPVAETDEKTEEATPVAETENKTQEPEATQSETESSTGLPKTTEDELFKPVFEWNFEPKESGEEKPAAAAPQPALDDLLSAFKTPEFVKPDEVRPSSPISDVIPIDRKGDRIQVIKMTDDPIDRNVSLNDRLSRGITVGLNDRIAFVKHLFNNSNEDYNRVLSQLITLDTMEQAHDFIDNMVKPDYNNWEGKDEYVQRFIEVIEKKFN